MTDTRVALVSGGTRGIGRAITERLLADGWSVLATYVHDAESAAALAARFPGLRVLRSDASSSADCAFAVEECLRHFGQIDHVVSVAGITRDVLLAELSDDDWNDVVATNLSGPFRLARAATPNRRDLVGRRDDGERTARRVRRQQGRAGGADQDVGP